MRETIEQIHSTLFEMLSALDAICSKNNIDYFLVEGTLLGAVRHQGFIPWDDDIDIAMTRENMQKLEQALSSGENSRLTYQSNQSDPNYPVPFDKVRLNGSTFIEEDLKDKNIHHGYFIDIFPLDGVPHGTRRQKWLHLNCVINDILVRGLVPNNPKMQKLAALIRTLCPKKFTIRRTRRQISKVVPSQTGLVSLYYLFRQDNAYMNPARIFLDSDLFFPAKKLVFEGSLFPVPHRFETYLTLRYGDFMQLPSEEERIPIHSSITDSRKNYTDYLHFN